MALDWHLWAPPLDPPVDGGLPEAAAESIAAQFWPGDPWLALALMWEAYAFSMPAEAGVASVSTGAQTIAYTAAGGSLFDLAMRRAQMFRDQIGTLRSVPLRVGPGPGLLPVDWWQRDLEDPATWERRELPP